MSSSTSNYYDLRTTCRSCLQASNPLISLHCYPNTTMSKTTGELMMACANVKITADDGLPQNVCTKCLSDLKAAFAYKTICEESDTKLRSVLCAVSVKLERCDEQGAKIDVNEYPFEVNWFPSLESDTLEADLVPKVEVIDPEPTDVASKIIPPSVETAFAAESILNTTEGNSLERWGEVPNVECQIEQNDENEDSNKSAKETVQTGSVSTQKTKKEKNVMCEVCSGTFYSMGQLKLHYVKHTGQRDYVCDICKRQYSTKAVLKDHMRTNHMDKSKRYCHMCPCCGKGFAYRRYLRDHMHVHSGERLYKCDLCPKTYTTGQSLNLHKRKHFGEGPYPCDECATVCSTKPNLKMHKRKHDPVKPCICEICGKGFIRNMRLIIHMRRHTGERPFECNLCDSKFSERASLRKHIRLHSGELCHKCDICGKSFVQGFQLRSHRRKMGHWTPGTEPPATAKRAAKAKKERKGSEARQTRATGVKAKKKRKKKENVVDVGISRPAPSISGRRLGVESSTYLDII